MATTRVEPRVLLYDIETSPLRIWSWGVHQVDAIGPPETDWTILCFAWKWFGDKTIKVIGQDDRRRYKPGVDHLNDKEVVATLRDLFDEADVLVAHNGISFDQKKARARMAIHGLAPPSPSLEVDPCREARKVFGFTSNKLDSIAGQLGLDRKAQTGGFGTWLGCVDGDKASWAKMKRYNRQDVKVLEAVYVAELPWMKAHAPLNVLAGRPDACPRCLASDWQARGYRTMRSRKYRRFRCKNCGGYSSSPTSEKVRPPEYV